MDDAPLSPSSSVLTLSASTMLSWTDVLQRASIPKPEKPISSRVFGDAKSSNGVSVAVVDANAIIHGDKLTGTADKFVTVSEVFDEVRDPVSRQRLAFLPLHIDTMDPSSQAIKKGLFFVSSAIYYCFFI